MCSLQPLCRATASRVTAGRDERSADYARGREGVPVWQTLSEPGITDSGSAGAPTRDGFFARLVPQQARADDAGMPEPSPLPRGSSTRSRAWLLIPAVVAAIGLFVSLRWSTADWAATFAHPHRQPAPTMTADGAALWRIMLIVSAAALITAPWLIIRSNSSAQLERNRSTSPRAQTSAASWVIAGLVVLALLVRLPRLGESLWYDEIAAWLSYGIHDPGAIVGNYFDPSNHILHTLLSWLSVTVLEHNASIEAALRLPALIFSLLSIPAVFILARRCNLSFAACGFAAAFMALAPVCILEAAEARGYSMMIFFSAAATATLLTAWQDDRAWQWCLYSLWCALGVWTHLMFVFVPLGHALWIAWRAFRPPILSARRTMTLHAAVALVLAAILAATLYAPVIPDMLSIRETFKAGDGDEPRILGPEGWHALLQLGGSWSWWAAAPGLALLMLGMWSLFQTRSASPATACVFAAWLGLPLAILTIALLDSWLYARFLLFTIPGAALTIAAGLDQLRRRSPAACGFALVIVVTLFAADLLTRPPKQPIREAVQFLGARIQPGERMLIIGLAHPVELVYRGDIGPQQITYSMFHGRDLRKQLDAVQPRWIVASYLNRLEPEQWQLLRERGFTETARFRGWVDWGNGDLIVLNLRSAPGNT